MGKYRQKFEPVIKFKAAYDKNTGELLTFPEIRAQFFAAASQSPKAIRTLRSMFKMACPNCNNAELVFSFGSENTDGTVRKIAGSNVAGNRAHLKTKGKSTHSRGCIATVFAQEGHEVDTSKGFRIYLNFKEIADRNPRNGQLVMRNEKGKIIVRDPDLQDREAWALSSPDKILPLLRSGQFDRIRDSVAVHGNQKINWRDFFIHRQAETDPDQRIRHIARKILYTPESAHHPLMVDLQFDTKTCATTHHGTSGDTQIYKFPIIRGMIHPVTQKPISVQPQLFVPNHHLFQTMKDIHREHDEIFVMVENPRVYMSSEISGLYILGLRLDDPDMMCKANLHEIKDVANERAQKRQAVISQQQGPYTAPAA